MHKRFLGQGSVFSVVILSLLLGGCSDFSSPEGVIASAFTALKKEKVRGFKRALSGEALEKYGNLIGMAEIAKVLQSYDLSLGAVVLREVRKDHKNDPVFRSFDVEIRSTPKAGVNPVDGVRALEHARVDCDVWVDYRDPTGVGGTVECFKTPGGVRCIPHGGSPTGFDRVESQRCLIAVLE